MKKLSLNKQTIANLDNPEKIVGGDTLSLDRTNMVLTCQNYLSACVCRTIEQTYCYVCGGTV